MLVVSLKKIIQTGPHRATKDKLVEVPDPVGEAWVGAKFARVATEAEAKVFEAEKKAR